MAEYNTPCVNLMKKRFLGPSEAMLGDVKTFLDAHDEELEAYAKEKGLWKLSGWEESVNYIFEGKSTTLISIFTIQEWQFTILKP